ILLLCHSSGSARASAPPFARFPGSGPATKTRPGQHLSRSRSAEAQANLPQILGEEKRGDGRRRRRRRRRNEEGGGSKREETSYPPSAAPGRALPRAPGGARRGGCTAAMRGGAAHGRFRSEAAWPEAGPAAAASKATETWAAPAPHRKHVIAGECENGMQGVRIAAPLMRLRFALVILAQFRTVLRVEFGSCTQIGKPYQQSSWPPRQQKI
ncbi:unnamed protein product, partial [Prorocentrum cordatum]